MADEAKARPGTTFTALVLPTNDGIINVSTQISEPQGFFATGRTVEIFVCESREAARRRVEELAREGGYRPGKWTRTNPDALAREDFAAEAGE
jgi:hypothetical protein